MKFEFEYFPKIIEKIQVPLKFGENNGALRDDQYTALILSLSFLLRMRIVSDKVVYKIKTNILCSVLLLRKTCRLLNNAVTF